MIIFINNKNETAIIRNVFSDGFNDIFVVIILNEIKTKKLPIGKRDKENHFPQERDSFSLTENFDNIRVNKKYIIILDIAPNSK